MLYLRDEQRASRLTAAIDSAGGPWKSPGRDSIHHRAALRSAIRPPFDRPIWLRQRHNASELVVVLCGFRLCGGGRHDQLLRHGGGRRGGGRLRGG